MTNADIARIFREIAVYLDMDDVAFKPRAYEQAAATIDALDRSLAAIHADGGPKGLAAIPGIGKNMAQKIAELVTTGRLTYYQDLSDFQAQRLIDFLLRHLGAPVYNQAIQDARAFLQTKLDDLDGEVYEPEERG